MGHIQMAAAHRQLTDDALQVLAPAAMSLLPLELCIDGSSNVYAVAAAAVWLIAA